MNVAYIFSGQGSQYIGMHKIFDKYPSHSEKYFKLSENILGYNICKIIEEGPVDKINNTKFTQPAIFIISAIAFDIYKEKFGLPIVAQGIV
jgi:malonyl CoA-acyl carrier protein transacylase